MPDPSIQVHGVNPAPQRLVVDGYVSTVQPAPKAYSDSLYVIVPEMSTEVPLGPCEWMEGHGTALPAQGAKVVVVFDEREVPVIVWWEGQYAEPEPKPPLVSALPGEPKDGAEVYFQSTAMATAGIAWHLRFRAASAEHKWEFVGGPALYSEFAEITEVASETYVGEAFASPSIVLPLAGDYDVTTGLNIYGTVAGSEGKASFKIGATPASDEDATVQYLGGAAISTANPTGSLSRTRRKHGLTAVTLQQQYRSPSKAAVNFSHRWMSAIPIRVG